MRINKLLHICVIGIVFLATYSGCKDESEESNVITYSVSGTVTRSWEPDPSGDAIGDIYLFVMEECVANTGQVTELTAEIRIPDGDLSDDGAVVSYEITGLPNGHYYISGFQDDVPNTVNEDRVPETGDLVIFGAAAPRCEEFTVNGSNVSGVNVDFNWVMPFSLPISSSCEPEVEGDPIPDDGETYTITGTVSSSTPPGLGGDGVGTLTLALATLCFSNSGDDPDTLVSSITTDIDVDLSGQYDTHDFTFPDEVPNGYYYINGFLNDNTDDVNIFPGIGDLVAFCNAGPKCKMVTVNGGNVTDADYIFNMVMPFNLPGKK